MAALISFHDWLAKQKSCRTSLGEFAREATKDKGFPRESVSLEAMLDYVRSSTYGSAQTIAIARSAYRAYERSFRPVPS
jgi:uncharacterized protein YozE (UPF0346 family)